MNSENFLTLITLIIFGWSTVLAQDAPSEKTQKTTIHANRFIEWQNNSENYRVEIKNGDQLVFEVISKTGIDQSNDTQLKSVLYFSVDKHIQNFSFSEEELESINAFLRRHCRCLDAGFNKVETGTIKGQKISARNWKLDINITAVGDDPKNKYPFKYNGIATVKENLH